MSTIINPTPRKLRLAVPLLLPYRCYSPTCKANLALYSHITYLPSREEPCPHCKERGYIHELAIIHLIQLSQFGIIKASKFAEQHGTAKASDRYDFLCEKSKTGYKEIVKSPNQPRHYTDLPESATCLYCLREYNHSNFPRGEIVKEF